MHTRVRACVCARPHVHAGLSHTPTRPHARTHACTDGRTDEDMRSELDSEHAGLDILVIDIFVIDILVIDILVITCSQSLTVSTPAFHSTRC